MQYQGVNRVEAVKEMHEHELTRSYQGIRGYLEFQHELFELMRQLDTDEVENLALYALEIWGTKPPEFTEHLLMRLFCLQPDKFPLIHLKMLELGIYYPYNFYLNANHELSQAVVEKLSSAEGLKKSRLYEIFVRGSADYVNRQVSIWEGNQPVWWVDTFPIYPLEAGWELATDGKRRQLYHETCYPLVQTEGEKATMQREDTCQWCGHKLENLFDLDLSDSRLSFLQINGTRLTIPFCTWCHTFKTQFFEIDYSGNATWSKHNEQEPPKYIEHYDNLPNTLILSEKPRGQFESLILEQGHSQIGGFPFWVNDAAYPVCPSCKKHMQFIGQIQWMDIEAAEGWSYAYLCSECKIAAVNYDQT